MLHNSAVWNRLCHAVLHFGVQLLTVWYCAVLCCAILCLAVRCCLCNSERSTNPKPVERASHHNNPFLKEDLGSQGL